MINLKQAIDKDIFNVVAETSAQLQTKTYVVGGFVRDFLLKREAKKDIDFVCEGDGIELAEAVAKKLQPNKKVTIFKRFGTAMIHHNQIDLLSHRSWCNPATVIRGGCHPLL